MEQHERLFRCRSCRGRLFTSAEITPLPAADCCRGAQELRALPEDQLPGWVQKQLEEGGYTRGRLTCPAPGCGAKVGQFDFIGGATCDCHATALPPVRLVRSRLDEMPMTADHVQVIAHGQICP